MPGAYLLNVGGLPAKLRGALLTEMSGYPKWVVE
jgi:hypothetical protein